MFIKTLFWIGIVAALLFPWISGVAQSGSISDPYVRPALIEPDRCRTLFGLLPCSDPVPDIPTDDDNPPSRPRSVTITIIDVAPPPPPSMPPMMNPKD